MNELRVSLEAEAEMDDIWLFVARESRNMDIANRVVDGILSMTTREEDQSWMLDRLLAHLEQIGLNDLPEQEADRAFRMAENMDDLTKASSVWRLLSPYGPGSASTWLFFPNSELQKQGKAYADDAGATCPHLPSSRWNTTRNSTTRCDSASARR